MAADVVQRLREADQLRRDDLRALVQQLVEGVLAVGVLRLAPQHGRRCPSRPPSPANPTCLPPDSIVKLLEVGGQARRAPRSRAGTATVP